MLARDLESELEAAFGGTPAERRVVARQARDLLASGTLEADRGHSVEVADLIENLADAPEDSSLPERWNWWLGALEVAYGGYREFQVNVVTENVEPARRTDVTPSDADRDRR